MSKDKMTLLMVLHAHQPVGNFDHVLAYALKQCYEPVVETLARFPEFKVGLHFSGPLLSWFEKNACEFLEKVALLCESGQVEMLTGGYYEPLLASIPQNDAIAQIQKLTQYTEKRFKQKPKGLWLAERIWEPNLPAHLGPCDLGYTLVDDTHLYYAGLKPQDMFGYYLTERAGHVLGLFPTHKELRYSIPFKDVQENLDFLKSVLDQYGPTSATYGDDMEKFGLWPETYEWVFGEKWLERFIKAVLKSSDWLFLDHCRNWLQNNKAKGRIYLPTASYEEMLTWALPAKTTIEMESLVDELKNEGRYEKMRPFLRGGIWDNFLVKYSESNIMHKRMLYVSKRLAKEKNTLENLDAAKDHLYQAQCNCAYWHGLFGGLYLGHLRRAVHEHLIASLDLLDKEIHQNKKWATCEVMDLDLDGENELLLADSKMDVMVHPGYGGSLSVLNLRPQKYNLALGLTRRLEAYHKHLFDQNNPQEKEDKVKSIHDMVVFKEENLEKYLNYDWYQRAMFQDHILPIDTELSDFAKADYKEWGDFVDQPFELKESGSSDERAFCRLKRAGKIWAENGPWPLNIDKAYTLGPGPCLSVDYVLSSFSEQKPDFVFASEINYSFLAANDPEKYLLLPKGKKLSLADLEKSPSVSSLKLVNKNDGFVVNFSLNPPAKLWSFPIETISQSESGLERTYQGSSLVLLWFFSKERQRLSLGLDMTVE